MQRSPLRIGYETARVVAIGGIFSMAEPGWAAASQGTSVSQGASARIATRAPMPTALATIPLDVRHGWFIIEGRSSRGPLRLVFDTGSNAHGLTRAVVASLDLPRVGWTRLHGGSGSEPRWLVRGPDIWFGNAVAGRGTRVMVDDEFVTDDAGVRYDGVIGVELFNEYDVMIDAPAGALRLYGAGEGRPNEAGGRALPVEDLGCGLVHFMITIDGVEVGAILDTGAPDLIVNGAAARLLGLMATGPAFDLAPRGIGETRIPAVPTRLGTLQAGDARLEGMEALVADLALFEALEISDRPLVILGAPFLEACPTLVSLADGVVAPCTLPLRRPARSALTMQELAFRR